LRQYLVACDEVVPWLGGGGMGRPAAMAIMLFMFMPPATQRDICNNKSGKGRGIETK
jgi:hypothetical protein